MVNLQLYLSIDRVSAMATRQAGGCFSESWQAGESQGISHTQDPTLPITVPLKLKAQKT